ncbi:hypothetical protein LTR86_010227 [Recurvomyces mirabilis]|nr:hypothetical protein LTR86_010227 [Recurvomyces mirabilis]
MLFRDLTTSALLLGISAHGATAQPSSDHACGDLLRAVNASGGQAYAVDVYNCWRTVPFNPAVGTRLIKYWNDTLQFQSTLEYIKQPPSDYQQPAVDLLAGLQAIQDEVNNNGFANEYQFEAALQDLIYSAHDAHVSFVAGLLSSFNFGSANGLTSVSLDGVALPKVYFTDDLVLNQTSPDPSWQPSAIVQINGTDVYEYLTRFAALNSYGTLESHADYNLLFDSPAADIIGQFSIWNGDATFYPGDTFNYTMENGTEIEDEFYAVYNDPGPTGPLETGGDFYNFFVLGFYPASFNLSELTYDNSTCQNVSSWTNSTLSYAYPEPDVAQADLGCSGYVTGYLLNDSSVAVLNLPTFWAVDTAIQQYVDAVQQFIQDATAAGKSKIVIDLQQNGGGDVLLAYTVFRLFFPSINPYAGSFRRANPLANEMGSLITQYWESLPGSDPALYANVSADEWIATIRLNAATGANFSSWAELYGPYTDGVEDITDVERLNTSSAVFDFSGFDLVEPPPALLRPYTGAAPFAAENIIMLSDALCSSACALFMEMMNHDAGVRNVVIGGRPQYGPMQTPSGSRGATFYTVNELDQDIENAQYIDAQLYNGTSSISRVNRTNQDVFIYEGGISLRAQIRESESTPLAMQYLAADCRIFWTPSTFNNFTNLWKYAAEAAWTNPQLCVANSTGYATTNGAKPKPAPKAPAPPVVKSGLPLSHYINIPFLYSSGPMPDLGGTEISSTTIARTGTTLTKQYNPNSLNIVKGADGRHVSTTVVKQSRINKNAGPRNAKLRKARMMRGRR